MLGQVLNFETIISISSAYSLRGSEGNSYWPRESNICEEQLLNFSKTDSLSIHIH